MAASRHPCRRSHEVEDALHARPHPLCSGVPAGGGAGVRRPGQVEQVSPLGLVELQRPGQGVEDLLGHPAQVAALHADVVVHAHPGQERHLLPAQSLHAAIPAVDRDGGLLRRDPSPAGSQELLDLAAAVHGVQPTGTPTDQGGPVVTCLTRPPVALNRRSSPSSPVRGRRCPCAFLHERHHRWGGLASGAGERSHRQHARPPSTNTADGDLRPGSTRAARPAAPGAASGPPRR